MSDLWLMVVLVVALLIGNLWLLKRNSTQQLKRKTTLSRPAAPAQTAAAVQTSPVVVNAGERNQTDTPATKSGADAPGHSGSDSDSSAD